MKFQKDVQASLKLRLTIALAAVVIAGSAVAHHGWSTYDEEKTLKLEGVIQASTYENPHGTMKFKVSGENGKVWNTVLAPPSRMSSRGLSKDMLKEGTTATVVGYPSKEKPDEMRAENVTIGGKKVELR